MTQGILALVLYAHMPYVRQVGQRPYGEEMLHRVIAGSYLPLLNVLYDLWGGGIPFRLTIGMTPVLVEQLADADLLDRFEIYLLDRQRQIEGEVRRFQQADRDGGDPQAGHLLYLARFYQDWFDGLLRSFRERFGRDLVGAFAQLQSEGRIEILTSAATHAYLPLLGRDSSIYAQLRTGMASSLRHFGRLARGVWLPECGYRPARVSPKDGDLRPGLEALLAELNLRYTFADGRAVAGHDLVEEQLQAGVLPYDDIPRQEQVLPKGEYGQHSAGHTLHQPYSIGQSGVAVFGRDLDIGLQVWPASAGYSGDYLYRDSHRRDDRSGLPYWRITGSGVAPEEQELYDPYHAFHRAKQHAAHFVEVVRGRLAGTGHTGGRAGVAVAAFEAELFGHWWFEGITWLKEILIRFDQDATVSLSTAGDYLEQYPPEQCIALPASSWGGQGDDSSWLSEETEWIWSLTHQAEGCMEDLVARFPDAEGERLEVLKQAAREVLLLQSSDWAFLLATGEAPDYAAQRFRGHLDRFKRLCGLTARDSLDEPERAFLQECRHLDNPFLNIDYRVFGHREGEGGNG